LTGKSTLQLKQKQEVSMKYMGSKNRIAKHILPIMLAERKPDQWWVEPFVGGGNMIDKVDGNRIGADCNPYVIEALKLIRDAPKSIPEIITEDMYNSMKKHKNIDGLTGFTAFSMSFGGKFFGGYRRDKAGTKGDIENMILQTKRSKQSAIKQSSLIQNVEFLCCPYDELHIPDNSIIYCDPPYAGTTKYSNDFDHELFWQWCRDKANEGHKVFVSEYNAPEDFTCIWKKEIVSSLTKNTGSKKGVEKLFTI
jgi:DNA adenine methylase